MFSRMLLSTLAAAVLAAAPPGLASEPAKDRDAEKLASCCEQAVMHLREHRGSTDAVEKKETTSQKTAPRVEDDPFVRNQSWGG